MIWSLWWSGSRRRSLQFEAEEGVEDLKQGKEFMFWSRRRILGFEAEEGVYDLKQERSLEFEAGEGV